MHAFMYLAICGDAIAGLAGARATLRELGEAHE
jgi:hypothetical protein